MEDKKPCDDIFEGLADLLIKNGRIIHNNYSRSRDFDYCVLEVHTVETWDIEYGEYIYLLKAHDDVIDSIKRVRIERKESEDK